MSLYYILNRVTLCQPLTADVYQNHHYAFELTIGYYDDCETSGLPPAKYE